MKTLALLLLSTAPALYSQNFAGKWTGVADTIDVSGVKRQMPESFEFTINGKDVIAKQISRQGNGIPLRVVMSEDGTRMTLLRELDFEGGEHIRWHFEWKGDHLTGTVWSVHDSPKKWGVDWTGPIELKRMDH